jgi:hypothetical protein
MLIKEITGFLRNNTSEFVLKLQKKSISELNTNTFFQAQKLTFVDNFQLQNPCEEAAI